MHTHLQPAMPTSQSSSRDLQSTAPPSSRVDAPLTPLPADEKTFPHVAEILKLFKGLQTGELIERQLWTEFQLVRGEYDEIQRRIRRDETLHGYAEDKLRCAGHRHMSQLTGILVDMTTTQTEIDSSFARRLLY